jgi:ribose transport system permease protein
MKLNFGFDRFSGVYLLVIFIVVFSIWVPNEFLTLLTLQSVVNDQAVFGMIAIALLIPMISGNYDLSVGANANLCGLIAAAVQVNYHWPIAVAIVFVFGIGCLIGLVNGLIVVKFGVNSFIVTLGMASILDAIQVIVTANQEPVAPTTSAWSTLTQFQIGGFQIVIVYLIVLALLAWWFLDHTPIGRYLYGTGGDRDAARLSGVLVDRWSWQSMIIAGAISSVAGVLYVSHNGPSVDFGSGLLLPAFAAVFLGSTQLRPGRFNVWGTVLAIYVLATGVEGLLFVSGDQWVGDMFNGVALIAAVALASNKERKIMATRRKRGRRIEAIGKVKPIGHKLEPQLRSDSAT